MSCIPRALTYYSAALPAGNRGTSMVTIFYGVLPGALAGLIEYLGLAWLMLNFSGDLCAAVFGLPLTASTVMILAKGSALSSFHLICAGVSFVGVCVVVGCRSRDLNLRSSWKTKEPKEDRMLDQTLLNDSSFTEPWGNSTLVTRSANYLIDIQM